MKLKINTPAYAEKSSEGTSLVTANCLRGKKTACLKISPGGQPEGRRQQDEISSL
jgi:hypothetical protein